MLTDDADNDEEDGGVILLSNQQMCYNYPQWAEQYDKHKRNMKRHNEYHLPPRSSQFIWKKMLIHRKSNA